MEFKGLTSASHMSLPEAGYGSEEGQLGSEISAAVSGVTTPGASRLQASQLQERSTSMQRLHSNLWSTPAQVEQVFTICFTCFCKNFFLHERFSSEHLVATSTSDWPVSKRNSANSSAHWGRFLGSNSGSSSWMFAWAIGLPVFPPPGVRPGEGESSAGSGKG